MPVSFMHNREALWHALRMYDGDKLLNHIRSMYVNNLPCIKVKGVETCNLELIEVWERCVSRPLGSSMYI